MWITESYGTMTRQYDYLADAAREMDLAQDAGWRVKHVWIEGKPMRLVRKSSWLKEWWTPQLVVSQSGRADLRRGPGLFNGRWRHLVDILNLLTSSGVQGSDRVEVVFSREDA